jgi:hypothetical protein
MLKLLVGAANANKDAAYGWRFKEREKGSVYTAKVVWKTIKMFLSV